MSSNDFEKPLSFRNSGSNTKLIFLVHGITGGKKCTWDTFWQAINEDSDLNEWDVRSFGYQTAPHPFWLFPVVGVIRSIFNKSFDPSISQVSDVFENTIKRLKNKGRYESIVVCTHSMGGLVVQHALIKENDIQNMIDGLIMYGTPNRGKYLSCFGDILNPQVRALCSCSLFIRNLRKGWDSKYGTDKSTLPFALSDVNGYSDQLGFTGSNSYPFPVSCRHVTSGNHFDIIQPSTAKSEFLEELKKVIEIVKG